MQRIILKIAHISILFLDLRNPNLNVKRNKRISCRFLSTLYFENFLEEQRFFLNQLLDILFCNHVLPLVLVRMVNSFPVVIFFFVSSLKTRIKNMAESHEL